MPLNPLALSLCIAAAIVSGAHATTSSTLYIGGSRPTFTTPYTVNPNTGAATLFGNPVGLIEGMSYDSTRGRIVATQRNDNMLMTIHPITGAVGSLPSNSLASLEGLAYDANRDVFWASEQNNGNLYKINPVTGMTTLAQPFPLAGSARPGGLGFDAANDILYAVDDGRLYSINPTAAPYIPVPIGPVGFGIGFNDVDAMEFDPATGLLFIVNDYGTGGNPGILQRLASLDPATGLGTIIGPTGLPEQFGQGMAIVPEPTSLAALVLATPFFRRQRR